MLIKIISPQQPAEISSQDITETFNALVDDRSSVDAYKLNLIAPPKLILESSQLTKLEQ